MTPEPLRVHASALVRGEQGILIRGAAGAGKTALALALVADAVRAGLFARLVADDTVLLAEVSGRLVARPHAATEGLVERRGIGLLRVPYAPACVIRAIIDLSDAADPAPDRLPDPEALRVAIGAVRLPRLLLRSGVASAERILPCLDFLDAFTTGS